MGCSSKVLSKKKLWDIISHCGLCKLAGTGVVGALKAIYEIKCAFLDKIVNFGTQIVKIFLYRNFDGSKLVRPVFGRHIGFQNGRHLGPIFSIISKRKTLKELITS